MTSPQKMIGTLFVSLLILASASTGQAGQPPKKDKKAFTPEQVNQAEIRLKAEGCGLYRSDPRRREPWEVHLPNPVRKPLEPPTPINLIGFPNDTADADLARLLPFVKRFESLKAIMLWKTSKITAKGLQLIVKELPDLQGVILNEFTVADLDLAELAALQRVTWIEVTNCPIQDAGLRELAAIPNLSIVRLERNLRLTAKGIGHLANAKNLRELTADISADPAGMSLAIGKLAELTHLTAYPVGDSEAAELGKLKRLASLDLTTRDPQLQSRSSGLTDAGLQKFMGCKSLVSLKVTGPGITIEKVPELANLVDMKELILAGTGTNNAGLAILTRLKSLTRLDLSVSSISDGGVRLLADLPRLETLDISNTHCGDESLDCLSQVRSLRSLEMDGTRTTATTPNLSGFASLKYLSLQSTNVSLASFKCLEKARPLLVLNLQKNGPNLTQGEIGPLEKSLPNCKILVDPKATIALGWPGSLGWTPSLPTPKPLPGTKPAQPNPPPPPVAQGPPPKTPPPAPTGPIGGSSSGGKP